MDKEDKNTSPSAAAISRWENEGGALQLWPSKNSDETVVLADPERHILQCWGAAVVIQWNDIPTDLQRSLFQDAVSTSRTPNAVQLKEQIARFLHNHKGDAGAS